MSTTVNFGVMVTETSRRHKQVVLTGTDSVPDVDYITRSKQKLERGEKFTVTPTRLFACSINGIKILIRITVGDNTIVFPISTNMSFPIESGEDVSIEIENPENNTVSIPASVEYIAV